MDVQGIINNVKRLTLIGNTNAVADNVKLLAYLNMAYRRAYDRVVREYPFFSQTTQTVTVTDGSGTLSPVPFLYLSVRDAGNNYTALTPTDVLEEELLNPALDDEGTPSRYRVEGSTLKTYPKSTTSIRVRYVPDVNELEADSDATDIAFPEMFHDLLVWDTALIVAYDERDKIVGAELQYTEKRAEDDWGRLRSWLSIRAPQKDKPKVKPTTLAY